MKTLLMIRHSKTEAAADSDILRELTDKGIADAMALGRTLHEHGITADVLVSSPAARAKKTAALIACGIKYPVNALVTERLLYHGHPEDIVSYIRHSDDRVKSLIIVGHNPILLEAINLLGSEHVARLQTSHAVKFSFDTDSWESIGPETCRHMVEIL